MDASHLDDDVLSGALDGDPLDAAGQSHLAGCAACRARRDQLATARSALAGAPVEPVDELTRRRVLTAALDAVPGGVRSRPWYQRPALAGGVAAVLLALFAAVPFVTGGEDTGGGLAATAGQEVAGSEFLGDLGDLSDPAVLRERFAVRRSVALSDSAAEAAPGGTAAPDAPTAPPSPAAPAPLAARPEVAPVARPSDDSTAQDAEAPALEAAAGGLDRTVADACAENLAGGPARGSTLVAVATGTYRGAPAVVAVFSDGGGTTAFVAARDGCRLLTRFAV